MWKIKKPCSNCPFRRSSLFGWLGETRSREIVETITGDEHLPFFCHKTTAPSGDVDKKIVPESQHCAGAAILLHKTQQPNMPMRLGYVFGSFDGKKLENQEEVFDTEDEFIAHHAGRKSKQK